MDEPSTCGQGLASRSACLAKISELLASQARVLEAHMRALDPADPDASKELEAYAALVTAHRDIADRLSGTADRMADYRSLPMAPHDPAAMSDAMAHKAFENFVRLEQELTTLLQESSQADREMLHQMAQ